MGPIWGRQDPMLAPGTLLSGSDYIILIRWPKWWYRRHIDLFTCIIALIFCYKLSNQEKTALCPVNENHDFAGLEYISTHTQYRMYGPLTRYVKLPVAHAPIMPDRLPRHQVQRKPLVSDPGMHQDTCVTHVSWCMSGSLTRGGGENAPGIPGACATNVDADVMELKEECKQVTI